ncbi:uncharacterized protein LOC144747152 [Ciona intestinalis]
MKIIFILLLFINSIYTRSPMPKSLVVFDCEPRSRLSVSVSPDPLVYKKPFEITVKAWASFNYKEAWGKFDIWWGKSPGNTTRFFSGQSTLCGKVGINCNGRLGGIYILYILINIHIYIFITSSSMARKSTHKFHSLVSTTFLSVFTPKMVDACFAPDCNCL